MPLTVDHVLALEDFVRTRFTPSDSDADLDERPIELWLQDDRLVITPLDHAHLPADWPGRPVRHEWAAVGLCLPAGCELHVGAIVDRAGRADWFVVDRGVVLFDVTRSAQLVDDLCRRRLGRPTDPPSVTTDWYWLGCWLQDVVAAASEFDPELESALDHPRLLDMVSVAGCHPAVDVEELAGLDRAGIIGFVLERQRDHTAIADWSCIRFDAMIDDRHVGHRWARHLDDGAFSRWMSSTGLPLSTMAEALIEGCSPLALELIGAIVSDVATRRSVD